LHIHLDFNTTPTTTMDETSKDYGYYALAAFALHACLFPRQHLSIVFLKRDDVTQKAEAVEVMRWLGFANLVSFTFGKFPSFV